MKFELSRREFKIASYPGSSNTLVKGNEPGYEAKFKKLLERLPHFFMVSAVYSVSRGVFKPQCRVISAVPLSVHVKVQE